MKRLRFQIVSAFVLLILMGMMGYVQASDLSFYGMKIEDVQIQGDRLSVTTTGANYILEQNRMEMWRRVDPATNTFDPRLVARLEFDTDIVDFTIVSQSEEVMAIHTSVIDFTFHADSFFFVKANTSFSYRHINLIETPICNYPVPAHWGSGLDRMWTDGYGGSLHAWLQGNPTTTDIQTDDTTMQMNPGDRMGHMVYPPKLFNFPRLYGENARPFVCFISSDNGTKILSRNWDYYKNLGIGVIALWNNYYPNQEYPILLEELNLVAGGTLGYRFREEVEPLLSDFIQEAHAHGFKVIAYLRRPSLDYFAGLPTFPTWIYPAGHPQVGQLQPYTVTLQFMKLFQDQYDLDGWYMDSADAGTLWEDYDFIKQARRDVDLEAQSHGFDAGVIYHHNTTDIWFDRVGELNGIMINAHVDYILRGEWHASTWVDHPNELYLRFQSSGYGFCQSFGSHKRCTRMKLALSEEEKNRIMADLNGAERFHINNIDIFLQSFIPFYEKRRNEYVSGKFDPDVQWPVDTETGWFRLPENITVNYPDLTSAIVNWRTNDPATSEVTYSSSGHWWPNRFQTAPDGIVSDDSMVSAHSIVIHDLDPNKNYEFRIRSSNGKSGLEEVIWGYKRENVSHTIMASAGEGGRITPGGTVSALDRKDRRFAIYPNLGYQITDVQIDGIPQGPIRNYTFQRVSEDHTIQVIFHWTGIHTITILVGQGGFVFPNGSFEVTQGTNQTIWIIPFPGYQISDVIVDDISQGAVDTYTFTNVTQNHTVQATFAIKTYTLTASASVGGRINPAGEIQIAAGESVTYTIIPDAGYSIMDVLVDGISQGTITTYTFQDVQDSHTISAQFAKHMYSITALAGSGGTINPSGTIRVAEGENRTFVIMADDNHYIKNIIVDNIDQGAQAEHTFSDITQDHTLVAIFGTVNVNVEDTNAPKVVNCAPQPDSIQMPRNSLIMLHIVDAESGVDPNSIVIQVQDEIIYAGGVVKYDSLRGCCRRIGTTSDYGFTFQPNALFDFDQEIQVSVVAADRAGNVSTDDKRYSFRTEMRRFGGYQFLHPDSTLPKNNPRTACDGLGTLWVAWEAGVAGNRDIYVSWLAENGSRFVEAAPITNSRSDQCRPDIAVDHQDRIYLVWQDNLRGNWDVYLSTSIDGLNWSAAIPLIDSDQESANQTNPRMAVARDNTVYVVWQDDGQGNQDIFMASSANGFVNQTITALTIDSADQTQPDIALGRNDTVFVVWMDARNDSADIYGADSVHNWVNIPVVKNSAQQTQPALVADAEGSNLHLVWTDDSYNHKDIYYAALGPTLPQNPCQGINIVDDSTGADQTAPQICTGYNDEGMGKVFICWQDDRNITSWNLDRDIYFTEGFSTLGVNILVTDDASYFGQGSPALSVNATGQPYLVWAESNGREGDNIVYRGTTHIRTPAVAEKEISAQSGGYVGALSENISGLDDVGVEIPAGALWSDLTVGIMKVNNPSVNSLESRFEIAAITQYEFSPSSMREFAKPVIITIPYEPTESEDETIYWYNPQIDGLSQSGISGVKRIKISETLYALRFGTTHFSQFVVASAGTDVTDEGPYTGGGSGGGCAMSRYPSSDNGIEILEFFLPYMVLLVVWSWLRQKEMKGKRNSK